MSFDCALPLLILMTSLIPGGLIFIIPEERRGLRSALNLSAAVAKLILVAMMVWGVRHAHVYETRLPLLPGLQLRLSADSLSVLPAVALYAVHHGLAKGSLFLRDWHSLWGRAREPGFQNRMGRSRLGCPVAVQQLAAAAHAVLFIRIPERRTRDASPAHLTEYARTIEFFIGRWPISGLLFLF